jgi:hypothetical protein
LSREKTLFAKIQSLRYAFTAHFGERAMEPFAAVGSVHNQIESAASTLIQITTGDDSPERSPELLLDSLGWGMAERPDDIDRKIEKAVQDIEKLCCPVLSRAPTQ